MVCRLLSAAGARVEPAQVSTRHPPLEGPEIGHGRPGLAGGGGVALVAFSGLGAAGSAPGVGP